jgi:hypothetical protein
MYSQHSIYKTDHTLINTFSMGTDKRKKGDEPAIGKLGGRYFRRKTGDVTLRLWETMEDG